MLTINITMRRSSALYRCKCVLYTLNRYTLYDAQLNWLPYTNIECVCILGPFEGEITITFARIIRHINYLQQYILWTAPFHSLPLSCSMFLLASQQSISLPKNGITSTTNPCYIVFHICTLSISTIFGFISRFYWFKRCVFKCKWIGQRI